MRRAGIPLEPAIGAKEDTVTRLRLSQASLDYLEHLDDVEATPPVVIDRARRNLLGRRAGFRTILDGDEQHDSLAPAYWRLRRDLHGVEQDGVEQDGVDATTHGSHATGAARPGTLLSEACRGSRAQ